MPSEHLPFSKRLHAWRTRTHLNQVQASKQLDIGRTYYSRLESGKKQPGKFLVEKFELLDREPVLYEQLESAQRTSSVVREDAPDYEPVAKVVEMIKTGTAQQRELLGLFLKSLENMNPKNQNPNE